MDAAKDFIEEKQEEGEIGPDFLDLSDNEPHTLTLKKAKRDTQEYKGTEREGISLLVTEDETPKRWFTSSVVVIKTIANCKPGDEIKVKRWSEKNEDGEYRTRYEVEKVGDEDVPVVEEDESSQGTPPPEEPPADF